MRKLTFFIKFENQIYHVNCNHIISEICYEMYSQRINHVFEIKISESEVAN